MNKVNISEKLDQINDCWNQRIVGELNGQQIRLVKIKGEFIIVPKGALHRPIAENEVHLMMFVSESNINTGNLKNEMTLNTKSLEKI